jgi:hypothetical protein
MLPITVAAESGPRMIRPTASALGDAVRRIGGARDRFLVVRRVPDLPEFFLQVWCELGGPYTLEYRDGGPDRHFRAAASDASAVIAALLGWVDGQSTWAAGFEWETVSFRAAGDAVASAAPLAASLSPEDVLSLESQVRTLIVGGYLTRSELTEIAEDCLVRDGIRPITRAQAAQLVDRFWLERVDEQASWVGETDPERLTSAFGALEDAGITARENFACCRSCGNAEIGAEGPDDARGFVYFHSQCTDAVAAGRGLSLYYGGFDDSSETTTHVGREVVAALTDAGLSVEWDGDPSRAITVTALDWRKRLVG